ncbi:hypothetical protein F5051DRAFT_328177, partial [Lentinula edodes]
QYAASKANFTEPDLVTGGSWKKSPVTTICERKLVRTCMPPKGRGLFLMIEPTSASLSNRSPSTMETVGMICYLRNE